LGAARATRRIRGAPDFVALHTSDKVRGDSRAVDFLHFWFAAFPSPSFDFNFFKIKTRGCPAFLLFCRF
jgi:hypothetical protein